MWKRLADYDRAYKRGDNAATQQPDNISLSTLHKGIVL